MRVAKEAPIIVVGVAKSVSTVTACRSFDSSVTDQKSDDEWPLSLKFVTLDIENVLKGFPNVSEIGFYRYEWCGNYIRNGSPEINNIDLKSRSIYFLRLEQNELRAFNDYTHTHLPLWSGQHRTADIQGNTIQEQLIWLMMTPGENMDEEAFAETLYLQVIDNGYQLEPQSRIFHRLLSLLENPNNLVQTGACVAIAWNFSGRYSCLSQPYVANAPSGLSWTIQGAESSARQRESVLRDKFLANPSEFVRHSEQPCDELDILSQHEDALIAKTALSTLHDEFPQFDKSGCER